ncbi:heme biosynthesis protein HemY [Sediminibacillus halophilus]|uniref:Iron-sulfur cluster insertion protein n=1 Tax=Sediminibacillus halophilus TaxID=482461 RepID=A0A1G9NAN7_9BACI|nr:heme biosynthesis protein HemY [Sediminibacillus halophilus]SDL83532.1 iron-sulfur cluster insertion protein [Sediminibacillus halophilus]
MKCKINRNAAKKIKQWLADDGAEGQMLRVFVSEFHGNHAHYDLTLDYPKEHDEIVQTDKEIDVLMDSREDFLDGVWIQYFYIPTEGFKITNSSKGHPPHIH